MNINLSMSEYENEYKCICKHVHVCVCVRSLCGAREGKGENVDLCCKQFYRCEIHVVTPE